MICKKCNETLIYSGGCNGEWEHLDGSTSCNYPCPKCGGPTKSYEGVAIWCEKGFDEGRPLCWGLMSG